MTTSPSSVRLLTDYPEIMSWVQAIERAAGPETWLDVTIRKRNGQPDTVEVRCQMKMSAEQKERP